MEDAGVDGTGTGVTEVVGGGEEAVEGGVADVLVRWVVVGGATVAVVFVDVRVDVGGAGPVHIFPLAQHAPFPVLSVIQ